MRRLILVRHAAPTQDRTVPARDWVLSPSGLAHAWQLAERLAKYAPVAVIASDEVKAQQTARPLAEHLGLPVEVLADLHEHERSTAAYLGADAFQATMARFFAEPDSLVFGEETALQARLRFATAVDGALRRHPSGDLAIVTHGTVLTLFVAAHNAVDSLAFWRRLGLPAWVVVSVPGFSLRELPMDLTAR